MYVSIRFECVLKFIPPICTPRFAGYLTWYKSFTDCAVYLGESNFQLLVMESTVTIFKHVPEVGLDMLEKRRFL